jgi:predicted RNA binding protein YcfA (HicA-like mRNA interferase family)
LETGYDRSNTGNAGRGDKRRRRFLKFSEIVRQLEKAGFRIVKEKGSIRYYGKPGWPRIIRVDYHGSKEIPTGTCESILKAAGLK